MAVTDSDELRQFMQVLYRALMMLARYLQKRYGFGA
jgi:hypothetical protein